MLPLSRPPSLFLFENDFPLFLKIAGSRYAKMEVELSGSSSFTTMKYTKLKAINELENYDHCFLTLKGVKAFTEPFGFQGSTYLATDNRSEFKGLNLGNGFKEGDKAEGQDAAILACDIADYLKVKYQPMFGRGSALRECCRAVREHLIEQGEK